MKENILACLAQYKLLKRANFSLLRTGKLFLVIWNVLQNLATCACITLKSIRTIQTLMSRPRR